MNFFQKMYRNGLGEGQNALSELRTSITNLIIIFTAPYVLSYLPIFYKLGHYHIVVLNLTLCLVLFFSYYLNNLKKNGLATKIVFVTSILLIITPILSYGRDTELQALYPIMMVFVFVLFDKTSEQILFSTLILIGFIGSFYILDIQEPLIQKRVFKYDYYLNMGFAIFSCGFLAYIMMKTLNSYNKQQDEAYSKLADQNRIIKKQNEEMELFTMMASHDLKTPARTMVSFLGLLNKSGEIKSPESQEYLDMAMSGASQLNNLISGISDFKNLAVEKAEIGYENTDNILEKVIKSLDLSKDESVSIQWQDLHNINIASTELHHVFQNLIQNAIKYNKSHQKIINIESRLSDSEIIFTISDNGIGIEQTYLDYVFDPFKKLHSSTEFDSTGLGLAICKKIINSYKASIRAESKGIGMGTQIIIHFPLGLLRT